MNYFDELMRIAETVEKKEDADILRAAAIKLMPGPEPRHEEVKEIPGWGYVHEKLY